ncbi:1-aminocyclopropane-1-carboxylate synthase-like [Macadamia integrifolia]|uniref:1-aminocyclopropane-1-carboxylate synthase-like n=1 Tax=Macadamia integrifolia TaxID=60698 RepID=UPI001C4E7B98|nr:1-aminocyclopropane-1-carboxylate synthase-like [Macadamia integrifolia]
MGSSSTSSDHHVQHNQLLSKIATSQGHGEDSPYFDGWKAYDKNPYHATHNPEGVIQMGLAENQLCFDLIEDWIRSNPQASICTKEGIQEFKETANFQDYHGMPAFREAVAKFMGKARGGRVRFDPDRIVMGGGSTGANEIITFCLADPGDAFLVPSPYYPAFDRDLRWRTGVQLFPVICESSNGFKITKAALEEAYEKTQEANINLKGLLITNPSNPLGTTLDKETLQTIVSFINKKNIHLVCDEIYAATVFSQPKFTSISEMVEEDGDCNKDLIHIVYSLSKDMGFPGFRVGIVYSYNDEVVNCARKMSSFGLVSTQTQHLIATMLSDDEFVERFLVESPNRLAKRYNFIRSELGKVEIECLDSNAGLFCWMDLRKLLTEPTLEEEMKIWRVIVHDAKLNVSPGSSFHCLEPGWFRVCFANMDDETMEVALKRMQKFVGKPKEEEVVAAVLRSTKRSKSNLRVSLSFKSRRMEESLMSPCTMSPHSPLVSART